MWVLARNCKISEEGLYKMQIVIITEKMFRVFFLMVFRYEALEGLNGSFGQTI